MWERVEPALLLQKRYQSWLALRSARKRAKESPSKCCEDSCLLKLNFSLVFANEMLFEKNNYLSYFIFHWKFSAKMFFNHIWNILSIAKALKLNACSNFWTFFHLNLSISWNSHSTLTWSFLSTIYTNFFNGFDGSLSRRCICHHLRSIWVPHQEL